MIRFVQHISLLCCFFLLFLLQDDHLTAQPSTSLRDPITAPGPGAGAGGAAPGPMQDIIDIYGPLDLPDPPPYHLYAALAAIGLLLAVLIVFTRRLFTRKTEPLPDPAATARAGLEQAAAELDRSGTEVYCRRVSDILRVYLEQRTGCRITRCTSSEALDALGREQSVSGSEIDLLRQWFAVCDRVKYGRFSPPPEEMQALDRRARALLSEQNRPVPEGSP